MLNLEEELMKLGDVYRKVEAQSKVLKRIYYRGIVGEMIEDKNNTDSEYPHFPDTIVGVISSKIFDLNLLLEENWKLLASIEDTFFIDDKDVDAPKGPRNDDRVMLKG